MKNPYRTWTRWSWYTAAALTALALAFLPLGGDAALVGGIVGGVLAFSAALTAAIFHFYARRADRHLEAFRRGEHLAHWTFLPEEWSPFSAAERERVRKRALWAPVWGAGICGIVGLALVAELGISGAAAGLLLGGAAGWGVGRLMVSQAEKAHGEEAARPEVYVGPEAALVNGKYFAWTGLGMRLVGLQVVEGTPTVLEFEVRVDAGESATYQTHRVPVPAGREEEAARVVAELGF